MANIVPFPKPNKDTDKGTSYRPISLLSVIAKTLEKSLLPYITANIPNTPMQDRYKTQHSTVTALHTLNNTVAKGFNQKGAPVQVMAYTDDITITSTHTSTSAAKKYIQPYLHKVFAWTKQNNLLINPDKTTCTLFTPDPAEYASNLDLTINNKALPMATHPKVLGLTLDPKLTYSTHIHNISVQAHKPLQIIKALTATGWGKLKETLMATYKAQESSRIDIPQRSKFSHLHCSTIT